MLVCKLITYYIEHFFFFEVPAGKKFIHLNEYFNLHFDNLTAYAQFMYHFQLSIYPRRTSFSDPKGYFGKIIKLLGNYSFLCIAHLDLSLGKCLT